MKNLTVEQAALASRLTTFRPSDRQELSRALGQLERRGDVMRALAHYVETWEKADWLEDYSIERIGKWFAISADAAFLDEVSKWARERQTKARKALRVGIRKGVAMPADEKALANRELAEL